MISTCPKFVRLENEKLLHASAYYTLNEIPTPGDEVENAGADLQCCDDQRHHRLCEARQRSPVGGRIEIAVYSRIPLQMPMDFCGRCFDRFTEMG